MLTLQIGICTAAADMLLEGLKGLQLWVYLVYCRESEAQADDSSPTWRPAADLSHITGSVRITIIGEYRQYKWSTDATTARVVSHDEVYLNMAGLRSAALAAHLQQTVWASCRVHQLAASCMALSDPAGLDQLAESKCPEGRAKVGQDYPDTVSDCR